MQVLPLRHSCLLNIQILHKNFAYFIFYCFDFKSWLKNLSSLSNRRSINNFMMMMIITIRPFVRYRVKLPVQLAHSNRFGIDNAMLYFVFSHKSRYAEVSQRIGQDLVGLCFTTEWLAHNHQTVSHQNHLINLHRKIVWMANDESFQ